mmetsp:Transcript_32090/g.78167  ORF Transcript_32090/g.78167 Transcript_32090/m.78167 type:complete len:126 (+) Transcript_32090:453-830(+)
MRIPRVSTALRRNCCCRIGRSIQGRVEIMTGYCDSACHQRSTSTKATFKFHVLPCPSDKRIRQRKLYHESHSSPSNVVVVEKMFGATNGGSKQQYLCNETEKLATIKSTRTRQFDDNRQRQRCLT